MIVVIVILLTLVLLWYEVKSASDFPYNEDM
jgi:hypothetical protein